ncbi:MAG TPA: AAA family ATPase, partial [Ramlibacter sp.]
RQHEFSLLKADWFMARANGRGQYRCLVGEPGIGKTRLLQEFEREVRRDGDPVTVLNVAGHREMQSSAFAALSLALDGDGLRELLPLLQGSPDREREQVLQALVAGCLTLAQRAPMCLIVDDAQWLDPSTIDFLERLRVAAAAVPLLLVVSLREEARGLVRGLDTQQALSLAALDIQESMDLIGALSGGAPLSPEIRSFIAGRAAGIPLFLEETVRMVGQLESEPSALVLGIPSTLEDLLTARLDALGAAKAMAQLAAVVGAEFPLSLWDELLTESDDWIRRARTPDAWPKLVDAGVLAVLGSGVPRCRFRHGMIRDAAYASIWRSDRKRLHGVVAQVLARHAVHGGTALRAHHLASAGELDAAFAAWTLAAREAAAAGADREALVLSQRALELLPELPPRPERRQQALQLHLLQAARWIALDGYGAASVEAAYLRAAALCNDGDAGTMRIRIDLGLEACYAMRGDLARARALAEAAVERTPWAGNPRLALQARWGWANVVFHQGEIVGALEMGRQCLARYEPALHHAGAVQDPAIMFLCYTAWGCFQQGRADEARQCVRRALELARTLDHPFSEAVAHGFAASVAMFCGDHAEGLTHAEEAMRRCSAKAFQAWLAHAQVMRGRLRAALGEPQAGLADMEAGVSLWMATGARITVPTYLALQAEVWLELGQPEVALQKVRLAQETAQRHGERYYESELLRLRGWSAWQLRGSDAEARAAQGLLQQGLGLAREQQNLGLAVR